MPQTVITQDRGNLIQPYQEGTQTQMLCALSFVNYAIRNNFPQVLWKSSYLINR